MKRPNNKLRKRVFDPVVAIIMKILEDNVVGHSIACQAADIIFLMISLGTIMTSLSHALNTS